MATNSTVSVLDAAHDAAASLGYNTLRQQQEEVICNFMSGSDVFAVLPTGFGKSVCYICLPAVFDTILGTPGMSVIVVHC